MANLKAQGLYDVADPDHDPESGDIYEQELFPRKAVFCIFCSGYFTPNRKGERIGQRI